MLLLIASTTTPDMEFINFLQETIAEMGIVITETDSDNTSLLEHTPDYNPEKEIDDSKNECRKSLGKR
ncbi:hypothetical protein E2C01_028902 [Portunus trituberculatus]|uniref:Uncharacterized protein n=1 Tax=Portunus trituberculatus TaxID=210409 RepID=A0A5B7EQB5_PORTR|nr:hypothetical protein [Portunus trituberculatus]